MESIRNLVVQKIQKDTAIPSFSPAARKLLDLASSQNVSLDEITEVVSLEPGLTTKFLRIANSPIYGSKSIQSVESALLRIGTLEVRRLAMTASAVDRMANLRVKVDWNVYWLHCLLTARLTEILCQAYRETTGREYLAGLLHDVGKLFLEHHFPDKFESILIRAMDRNLGMFAAEQDLYDIHHAEVSALLCEKWSLHREIIRAIRFHHEPGSPFNKDPLHPEDEKLLASAICVADILANLCKANIQGAKEISNPDLDSMPEYQLLQKHKVIQSLNLDLSGEVEKCQEIVRSFIQPPEQATS